MFNEWKTKDFSTQVFRGRFRTTTRKHKWYVRKHDYEMRKVANMTHWENQKVLKLKVKKNLGGGTKAFKVRWEWKDNVLKIYQRVKMTKQNTNILLSFPPHLFSFPSLSNLNFFLPNQQNTNILQNRCNFFCLNQCHLKTPFFPTL